MFLYHPRQAFREDIRSGEQLWQKRFGDTHLLSFQEETLRRIRVVLQIPILDQAFPVVY